MIANKNHCLTLERAQERLIYRPDTGLLIWRQIRETCPQHKAWNHKYAGEVAGRLEVDGYHRVIIDGVAFAAHRIAWLLFYGRWPAEELDHVNRRRNDNRISNLRELTHAENLAARKPFGKSGVLGIYFESGKWRARIRLADGNVRHLGRFANIEEAKNAIDIAKTGAIS